MSESNMQKMQSASDYTPTTGDVRARYVRDHGAHFVSDWAEFDRWLAEVKAQAWQEGQLALLEYMGVPLYPSKGDETRNPKQPLNPYRQGEA